MKKLAIGCGILAVLLVVGGGAAAYYLLYRPAQALISAGRDIGASLTAFNDLDAKVANTASFAAPADGALTEAQVTRYAAAMDRLHATMGARMTELETKYKALQPREGESPSFSTIAGAYRDFFGLIVDAKKAQVDALNSQNFSNEEYAWVRTRVFEAGGVQVTGLDFRELAEQAGNGNFDALTKMAQQAGTGSSPDAQGPVGDTPGVGIPEINKTLVAPHKERLQTWFAYAAFGL